MKRMRRWFAGQRAYAIGLAALVLAAGIKLALDPRTPFLLLLGTVMTAAWYGGLPPGLATTLLAALVGDYLFVPALRAGFQLHLAKPVQPSELITVSLAARRN